MDTNTTTHRVPRPKTHRVPDEYSGGYTFTMTDAYGEPRKYLVRRDLANPEWGWNVYKRSELREYHWDLIIDQMSSRDYAMKVAVADSLRRGITSVSANDVEWA